MTEIKSLSDEELRRRLFQNGFEPGPVTLTTRSVYERKLQALLSSKGNVSNRNIFQPRLYQTQLDMYMSELDMYMSNQGSQLLGTNNRLSQMETDISTMNQGSQLLGTNSRRSLVDITTTDQGSQLLGTNNRRNHVSKLRGSNVRLYQTQFCITSPNQVSRLTRNPPKPTPDLEDSSIKEMLSKISNDLKNVSKQIHQFEQTTETKLNKLESRLTLISGVVTAIRDNAASQAVIVEEICDLARNWDISRIDGAIRASDAIVEELNHNFTTFLNDKNRNKVDITIREVGHMDELLSDDDSFQSADVF